MANADVDDPVRLGIAKPCADRLAGRIVGRVINLGVGFLTSAQILQARDKKYFYTKDEGNEGVFAIGIAGKVGGQLTAMSLVGPTSGMEKKFDANGETLTKARGERPK